MVSRFTTVLSLTTVLLLSPTGTDGFQPCPDTPSVKEFNMEQFLGMWYVSSSTIAIQDCYTYKADSKDAAPKIENHGHPMGNYREAILVATYVNTDEGSPARFVAQNQPVTSVLKVLDTDYASYAVFLFCNEIQGYASFLSGFSLVTRSAGSLNEEQTMIYRGLNITAPLQTTSENVASCNFDDVHADSPP